MASAVDLKLYYLSTEAAKWEQLPAWQARRAQVQVGPTELDGIYRLTITLQPEAFDAARVLDAPAVEGVCYIGAEGQGWWKLGEHTNIMAYPPILDGLPFE
jgi:hypothetical protein